MCRTLDLPGLNSTEFCEIPLLQTAPISFTRVLPFNFNIASPLQLPQPHTYPLITPAPTYIRGRGHTSLLLLTLQALPWNPEFGGCAPAIHNYHQLLLPHGAPKSGCWAANIFWEPFPNCSQNTHLYTFIHTQTHTHVLKGVTDNSVSKTRLKWTPEKQE